VPNPAWKLKKYGKEWQTFDTVNATIGQGYFLVNPLQQVIQASRLASGRIIMPRLVHGHEQEVAPSLGIPDDHLAYVRQAMSDVANGPGSAPHARLPFPDIKLAGKTGTAQVVGLNVGSAKGGLWKHRDHGHFICFAPFDNPRFACSVVVEHGGGSGSAYPIARDVLTYVFDKQKGMDVLTELEKKWGGTPKERLEARYRTYSAQYGVGAPAVSAEEENRKLQGDDAPQDPAQPIVRDAASPAPEPDAADQPAAPAPAATPSPTPAPGNSGGNPQ